MRKGILTLLIASTVLISLTGCGSGKNVSTLESADPTEQTVTEAENDDKDSQTVTEEESDNDKDAIVNSTSKATGISDEITSEAEADDPTGWKMAYKEFLTAVTHDFSYTRDKKGRDPEVENMTKIIPDTYSLVYVDDDDVPELVVNYYNGPMNWYEYLYTVTDGKVNRVDYSEDDILSGGWRAIYSFKERTGEFLIEDGTGVGHYWSVYNIYDYNESVKLHLFNVSYQQRIEYTFDGKTVDEAEAKRIASDYFDTFECELEKGVTASGYSMPDFKTISYDNIVSDLGDGEVKYTGGNYGQSAYDGCSFTVPEGFYDYSFATTEKEHKYNYWNQSCKMSISFLEEDTYSSFNILSDYEYYLKRADHTVQYEYAYDEGFVVSGYDPYGEVYYVKEIISGNHYDKIIFEYPAKEQKDICDSILVEFLDNVRY